MSVMYDYDPGRLELYRPRADGLLGRCLCGSAVIHLLVGCLLVTVRLPQPPPPKRRPYRITQVTLLPRPRPAQPVRAEIRQPKQVAEMLTPRDLSLFLHDLAPAEPKRTRRRSRRQRQAQKRAVRTASLPRPTPAREVKPEAPDTRTGEHAKLGQQLASDLPHFLERPMVDRQPPELVKPPADTPAKAEPGGAKTVEKPRPIRKAKHVEVAAPKPPKPVALRPQPVIEAPRHHPAGGNDRHESVPSPRPVQMARAERPRPPSDLLPKLTDEGGSTGPSPIPSVPVAKPAPAPVERPADLPVGRPGSGKRIAELPGSLSGEGSSQGPGLSRREPSLPEGRPGAADTSGPHRPRVSRGAAGRSNSITGGDAGGISAVPAPGGVRLSEDDRPGAIRRGEPTGFGVKGGKGTREASLPSTGAELSGRGSGAAPSGEGAGGGFGAEGPRAFGGGSRPGRPSRTTPTKVGGGDGAGGSDPVLGTGIGIGGVGPGAGGAETEPRSGGGHHSGAGRSDGDTPGKRVARADLPAEGASDGSRGIGHSPGTGSSSGGGTETGPKSFGTGEKRRTSSRAGNGDGPGEGRGSSSGKGNGDEGGVSLPGGSGDGDDGPGRGAAGDGDSGFKKGRTKPSGVYVDTTGNYTLPGAIYQGDYRYNERALRQIMDELNSRTKVKVRLGGSYESISPGSFRKAPVVVFTGHKAFELTDEQRKLLKEYVQRGGMIWADLSHSAFDRSFRDEMEKIFGSAPVALSSGHPIFNSFYRLGGPPPGDFGDSAPFQGITVDGRLGVVITPNRYFSAVTKSLNARDEDQEGAIQAVVNVYMYAVGNYRAVKDAND